jgi:hypothetical protein
VTTSGGGAAGNGEGNGSRIGDATGNSSSIGGNEAGGGKGKGKGGVLASMARLTVSRRAAIAAACDASESAGTSSSSHTY